MPKSIASPSELPESEGGEDGSVGVTGDESSVDVPSDVSVPPSPSISNPSVSSVSSSTGASPAKSSFLLNVYGCCVQSFVGILPEV